MANLDGCKSIEDFTGWLSSGLGRPTAKFIQDMLYGIHTSRSVRLADIARALGESCDLHATRNRLSRNLANTQLATELSDRLLRQGAHSVKRNTRLFVQVHALTKPNARKMQYLYDQAVDSAREPPSSAADSYQVCEIVASNTGSRKFLPLLSTFWSRHAPDYVSDVDEISSAIHRVLTMTNGRGIVFLENPFVEFSTLKELIAILSDDAGVQFVSRIHGDDTSLKYRQQSKTVSELGELCNTQYACRIFKVLPRDAAPKTSQDTSDFQGLFREIISSTDGDLAELSIGMEFGSLAVRHQKSQRRLSLIVLKYGVNIYLLTSLHDMPTRKSLLEPISSWFSTWEVVSAHLNKRDDFTPGEIGVMTYDRLRLLLALLHAVVFFESRTYKLNDYSLTQLQPHDGRRFHRDFLLPEDVARMKSLE